MVKPIRSIKTPNFLTKNIAFLIISAIFVLVLLFYIKPTNIYIVLLFLLCLLFFLTYLFSTIWFLVVFNGQQRVWYLKTNEFSQMLKKSNYVALTITLYLFLRYLGQDTLYSIIALVLVIGIFGYFDLKRQKGEFNNN